MNFAFLFVAIFSVSYALPTYGRGFIKNDASPWMVQLDDGERFGCVMDGVEFNENAYVSLTVVNGTGLMISMAEDKIANGHCVDLTK